MVKNVLQARVGFGRRYYRTSGKRAITNEQAQLLYEKQMSAQIKAVCLVASCLEGREGVNDALFSRIADSLDSDTLDSFVAEVISYIENVLKDRTLTYAESVDHVATAKDALVSAKMIYTGLSLTEKFTTGPGPLEKFVGKVEVAWKGNIEAVSFPLPIELAYLRESTKAAFMNQVDLSTPERRMKGGLSARSLFVVEMDQVSTLARYSSLYAFVVRACVRLRGLVSAFALGARNPVAVDGASLVPPLPPHLVHHLVQHLVQRLVCPPPTRPPPAPHSPPPSTRTSASSSSPRTLS